MQRFIAIILLSLVSSISHASLITFSLTGIVSVTSDPQHIFQFTPNEYGMVFGTGSFTFDDTTPDSMPNSPYLGVYDGALKNMSFNIDGYTFEMDKTAPNSITVRGSASYEDSAFRYSASLKPKYGASSIMLYGDSGDLEPQFGDSLSFYATHPRVGGFSSIGIFGLDANGTSLFGLNLDIQYFNNYQVSVAEVPLPASLYFLASGFGLLGIASRRNK